MIQALVRLRSRREGNERHRRDATDRRKTTMTALASRPQASPAPSRGAGHVALPLSLAVMAAAGVWAIHRVFIGTITGQAIDTGALNGAEMHHPRIVEVLSRTLNGTTLVSLVLVCVAAAAIGMMRRRLDLAVGAAVVVIGANVTSQLLKTHLERPNLDGLPAPNSFPSGHTTAAASVAFALILALPQAIRGMVALIGAAYVTVIAVATVWAEWHRPSDTVAGLLVVLAWGGLVSAALRAARLRRPGPMGRPTRLTTLVLGGVFGLTAVAGLLGLAAVVITERTSPHLLSGRLVFLTGAACITAAVAGTFLVWVRLAAGDVPATGAPGQTDVR
jgi:membrane-associated phospholipid phosphatase